MRFLADENFPGSAVAALRQAGFQVVSIAESSPGLPDEAVLQRCASEKLTLLTLDKDFGELVFRLKWPVECGIILFRVAADTPPEFAGITLAALRSRDDWAGMFAVISRDRIRLRPITPP